jgi:hypothetical protein
LTEASQSSARGKTVDSLSEKTSFAQHEEHQNLKDHQRKKKNRSCYVMLADKQVPTIPRNQGFCQSLWDHPERSNRLLKRKPSAPSQANGTRGVPQAKQSNASPHKRVHKS